MGSSESLKPTTKLQARSGEDHDDDHNTRQTILGRAAAAAAGGRRTKAGRDSGGWRRRSGTAAAEQRAPAADWLSTSVNSLARPAGPGKASKAVIFLRVGARAVDDVRHCQTGFFAIMHNCSKTKRPENGPQIKFLRRFLLSISKNIFAHPFGFPAPGPHG